MTGPLTTHGQATWDLLDLVAAERGHDLRPEEWPTQGRVQHWDCHRPGCSAVFVRRFADGAVGGSALRERCPIPVERVGGCMVTSTMVTFAP